MKFLLSPIPTLSPMATTTTIVEETKSVKLATLVDCDTHNTL